MLLSGRTGEEGGHDWIFLFSSLGLLHKAQFMGALVHKLGTLTVICSLVWGACFDFCMRGCLWKNTIADVTQPSGKSGAMPSDVGPW